MLLKSFQILLSPGYTIFHFLEHGAACFRRDIEELKNIKDLKTNENFIGVNYTGYMDTNTAKCALKNVKTKTEAILHPSSDNILLGRYNEFCALVDEDLKQFIKNSDIELVNFLNESKDI